MRRLLSLLLVVALVPAVVAGCGSSSKTSSTGSSESSGGSTQTTAGQPKEVRFAKTKFVLHAGLAFGAFHRWIWKPYRAGSFSAGAPGRTKNLVKAGLAAAFTYHEVKAARNAAEGSATLRRLVAPLAAIGTTFASLPQRLRNGTFSPQDLNQAQNAISGLSNESKGLGAPIKERAPAALPGG